ncbi:MAG: hypothetical protein OXJ90_00300 [Spirochaetaceae bacterium]|nr:hypothetical protein [Spirochaetaceae bacterium]
MAYGGGRFVAVGSGGTIVHSTDGSSWQEADASAATEWLHGVSYGGERFVAVGGNGTIVASP